MNLAYGHELGKANYQDISLDEITRLKSMYIIGSSGSGKSSLLATMIHQDAREGVGHAVFDVEDRLSRLSLRYQLDAGLRPTVIDPAIGITPLNLLSVPAGVHPHSVLEACLQTFQRYWWDSWGPRTEDILRHSLLLLMEHRLTLGELPHLLSNTAVRVRMAESSQDERVRIFFLDHLRGISGREYRTWIEAVRNKVGALMSNPFLAPCLSTDECLDLAAILDQGTPLVVNLSEKALGDSGRILGALLVSRLYQVALRRPSDSAPYYAYVDEFQTLLSRSFVDLVTRSRKRGLGSILAHQTTSQPPFDKNPDFLTTILNNVATKVVMQVGREDAERFAKEIFPATGTEAKRRKKHWLWGDFGDPQFYSVQEEREHQCAELEHQFPRELFIRIKGQGSYCAEAYDLPEPRTTEAEADEYITTSFSAPPEPQDRLAPFRAKRRPLTKS